MYQKVDFKTAIFGFEQTKQLFVSLKLSYLNEYRPTMPAQLKRKIHRCGLIGNNTMTRPNILKWIDFKSNPSINADVCANCCLMPIFQC